MLEDNVFDTKLNFDDNNNNTQIDGLEMYPEDDKLALAQQECIKTGTIIPLLKEELKFKILAKCHEEGKQLTVEPEHKPPPQKKKLQPEEQKRKERRKEQNRRAAKKFRERKRSDEERLEQNTLDLESVNQELREEINRLQVELNDLNALWTSHLCVIHAHPPVFDEPGLLDTS